MRSHSTTTMAKASTRRLGLLAATIALAATTAQAQTALPDAWRISASAGGYVPRASVIIGADGRDTKLSAGPSFSLDVQYLVTKWASIYGNGTMAFSTISLGTAIKSTVVGPSNSVTLTGGTAGVVLAPTTGLLGGNFRPTLRLGGGYKGYSFDLKDVDSQWRTTGDIGIGFRGVGTGPIEVSAEVRYLPSSFDQGKLPLRGIVPQAQRQTDLIFGIGVSIRH